MKNTRQPSKTKKAEATDQYRTVARKIATDCEAGEQFNVETCAEILARHCRACVRHGQALDLLGQIIGAETQQEADTALDAAAELVGE